MFPSAIFRPKEIHSKIFIVHWYKQCLAVDVTYKNHFKKQNSCHHDHWTYTWLHRSIVFSLVISKPKHSLSSKIEPFRSFRCKDVKLWWLKWSPRNAFTISLSRTDYIVPLYGWWVSNLWGVWLVQNPFLTGNSLVDVFVVPSFAFVNYHIACRESLGKKLKVIMYDVDWN